MHRLEPRRVEGQLTVEERLLGGVVPDPSRSTQMAEGARHALLGDAGPGRQPRYVDPRLERQQHRQQLGVQRGLLVGEVPEHASLPENPREASGLRARTRRASSRTSSHRLAAAGALGSYGGA